MLRILVILDLFAVSYLIFNIKIETNKMLSTLFPTNLDGWGKAKYLPPVQIRGKQCKRQAWLDSHPRVHCRTAMYFDQSAAVKGT